MSFKYKERFNLACATIKSSTIKEFACITNPQSFTRKRKIPLEDILFCTLSKKGLTTTMELYQYLQTMIIDLLRNPL